MTIKAVYKPSHENRNYLETLGHGLCNHKDVKHLPEYLMFLHILSTWFDFILIITVTVTTI